MQKNFKVFIDRRMHTLYNEVQSNKNLIDTARKLNAKVHNLKVNYAPFYTMKWQLRANFQLAQAELIAFLHEKATGSELSESAVLSHKNKAFTILL